MVEAVLLPKNIQNRTDFYLRMKDKERPEIETDLVSKDATPCFLVF